MADEIDDMGEKVPKTVSISTAVSGTTWNIEIERAAVERVLGYEVSSAEELIAETEARVLQLASSVAAKVARLSIDPPSVSLADGEIIEMTGLHNTDSR